MAYAQQAYRLADFPVYEGNAARVRERSGAAERSGAGRISAADVRTMRTGGASQSEQGTSVLVTAARLGAVVLVLVAALAFARIALTNAAVTTMIESDAISAQIEEARSSGIDLEMQQSVLTSPTSLKQAVKRLGMAAPEEVGMLALAPDVVAQTESGGLSLSDTVKNVVEAQG